MDTVIEEFGVFMPVVVLSLVTGQKQLRLISFPYYHHSLFI